MGNHGRQRVMTVLLAFARRHANSITRYRKATRSFVYDTVRNSESCFVPTGDVRRPVSRVLSPPPALRMTTMDGHSSGTDLAARLTRHTRAAGRECPCVNRFRPRRQPLFGLAPGGVYPAAPVARGAVRSYRTVSPLPACTHVGGLFSVALSLGSPPPAVSRHRIPVEPGLSSTTRLPRWQRPPSRLTARVWARAAATSTGVQCATPGAEGSAMI